MGGEQEVRGRARKERERDCPFSRKEGNMLLGGGERKDNHCALLSWYIHAYSQTEWEEEEEESEEGWREIASS